MTENTLLPSDPALRVEILGVVKNIAGLEYQKESVTESIKEAKAYAKEKYGLSPKDLASLVKMFRDDTFAHEEYSKAEILYHTNDILQNLLGKEDV